MILIRCLNETKFRFSRFSKKFLCPNKKKSYGKFSIIIICKQFTQLRNKRMFKFLNIINDDKNLFIAVRRGGFKIFIYKSLRFSCIGCIERHTQFFCNFFQAPWKRKNPKTAHIRRAGHGIFPYTEAVSGRAGFSRCRNRRPPWPTAHFFGGMDQVFPGSDVTFRFIKNLGRWK